eukprot:1674812-Rhodomonas_salina.1
MAGTGRHWAQVPARDARRASPGRQPLRARVLALHAAKSLPHAAKRHWPWGSCFARRGTELGSHVQAALLHAGA